MSEPVNPYRRIAVIVGVVVLLHLAALWALQGGLLRRAQEVVLPVQMVSVWIAPAVLPVQSTPLQPRPAKSPPAAPARPAAPVPAAVVPRPAQAPAPQPMSIADAAPTPAAPVGVLAPQVAVSAAPVAVATSTGAAQAAAAASRVELPSSDADYLSNPKPRYPPLSVRLNEQGRVLVRVFVNADGLPQKVEIKTSSGFERLDHAALATVLKWRFVPGKRGGVAEAMWAIAPVSFFLE